jgi:RND family efflux transporter MFP subunit
VPADAVLVEIDPTEFELAVEEAERSLEKELAKLGRDQPPGEGFDLLSLPAVVRGRLLKENAAQRYERQKEMLAKNATAKEAFEQSETDLKVAEAALKTTVLEAEETLAAVRHQQAVLALARQRLVETQVRAPSLAPGESEGPLEYAVAKRLVSVGEMTRPTSPVFGLVLDHTLKLRPKLPERYVSEIRAGQKAQIRLEAYPERVFEGQVSRIHPTVDPVSRTFEIEVLVPNQERLLKAGSFAKAEILTRVDARAIVVPVEALVTYAGVDKVFQVRAGKAHEVKVALGEQGRGWLELVGPLEPGSLVVTSGQSQLADGTPVRLRERGPAAAAEEGLEKTGEGAADR